MLADVRYQVFVSSTYEDLREERQQATQAILEMNHMPSGMELFPASDLAQWELIKTVINECDYYVVIVGGRYGSVHKDTGLSFTEMEYDYATAQGVPVLGFVRKDIKKVPSGFVDADPVARTKLEAFREKVMSRTCRAYDEPIELGMLVMKSLMNETRTNPRIGWVRADQARGREDIEREQQMLDELSAKDRAIKALERKIRDIAIPLDGISRDQLASGEDKIQVTVLYQDKEKQPKARDIALTWDEMFLVIGAQMFGYTVRRARTQYGNQELGYPFEDNLISHLRTKIYEDVGNRQIKLLPHQIDAIMLQFKQLGLIEMKEHERDDKGDVFRGFSLTEYGEEYLTRLSVKTA